MESVRALVLAICVLFSAPALAQQHSHDDDASRTVVRNGEPEPGGGTNGGVSIPLVEWEKRQNSDERLTAFGDDLFGDSIDPHTGGLSFEQTDVSLPGNFSLPVAITRRREAGFLHHESVHAEFGDWEHVVPRIKVITAQARPWTGTRCSTPFNQKFTPVTVGRGLYVQGHEYSNGVFVDVPGAGKSELLQAPVGGQWPSNATHVTTSNWYFTCGHANDGGQGFIGYAPNGDRYRFDRVIKHRVDDLGDVAGNNVARDRYIIAATDVTDVNGNWVRYNYDASGRLYQIRAADGRTITLTYQGSSKLVSTVNANGRVWTYTYRRSQYRLPTWKEPLFRQINSQILDKVELPDATNWEFDIDNLTAEPSPAENCQKWEYGLTIKHPYAATAQFQIKDLEHRYIFAAQLRRNSDCPNAEAPPPPPPGGGPPIYPLEDAATTSVMSVTRKSIAGHSLPPMVWTYEYEQDKTSGTSSADRTNWTKVTGPGTHITYKHKWTSEPEGGAQVSMEVRNTAASAVLQTTTTSYLLENSIGTALKPTTFPGAGNQTRPRRTDTVTIDRHGAVYNTINTYNTNTASSSYSYGYPTRVVRDTNVTLAGADNDRVMDTTYRHDRARWVLGKPLTETYEGRLYHQYYYDVLGRVYRYDKFGALWSTYSYHTAVGQRGALRTHTNAENNTATFTNYKRGKPQNIQRYDNTTVSQVVDDNGWVTRQADARGNVTNFDYNDVGWRTLIDRPAPWADTTLVYTVRDTYLTQILIRGWYEEIVWYDAMLRPWRQRVRSRQGDTPLQHKRWRYDGLGRVAFEALPSTSGSDQIGTRTTHDALGRVTHVRAPVTNALTRTQYVGNGAVLTDDPEGNRTVTYMVGYGNPDGGQVARIIAPLDQRTYISFDVYGNITSIRQFGTQNGVYRDVRRSFWYNGRNQLCRHRAPEVGGELYSYDVMDRQHYKASGLSMTGTGCATPPVAERIATTYDAMGRVEDIDYPPGTPDIHKDYDPDGNLVLVSRDNGTSISYHHDALNNIDLETHTIDQRVFQSTYTYTPEGFLDTLGLAPLSTIDLDTNGIGQPRGLRVNGTSYASGAVYHVGGELTDLTLSNGFVYDATINNRLLTSRATVRRPSNNVLAVDYGYTHEALFERVQSITDYVNRSRDRSFTYDALGRLKTANSSVWGGNGSFEYDVLGNLMKKTLGSRTVDVIYSVSRNRLYQMRDSAVSSTFRTYGHDARGNVTFDARGGKSMSYDHSNQPTLLSGGGVTGTYVYDGNLKRAKSTVNGETLYSVYSAVAGNVTRIEAQNPNDRQTTYIKLGPVTAEFDGTQFKGFIHTDHQGSSVAYTTPSGAVAWREAYTPFGEKIFGSADDHVGYTGHVMDDATDLTYMQARYFDPVVGRFMSTDPIDYADQLNLYSYVHNDPIGNVDPDGRNTAVGAAVGCAATGPGCPVGAVVGAVVGTAAAVGIFSVVKSMLSESSDVDQSDQSDAPPLPSELVGDQSDPRAGPNPSGKKHTSGQLLPEHGGTGDYDADLEVLAGPTREAGRGDPAPPGAQLGENKVFGRDPNSSGGRSIDIPANGDKLHETLHYPPRDQ